MTSDVEQKSISCDGNRWHLIYMRERIREQWRRVRKGCNSPQLQKRSEGHRDGKALNYRGQKGFTLLVSSRSCTVTSVIYQHHLLLEISTLISLILTVAESQISNARHISISYFVIIC